MSPIRPARRSSLCPAMSSSPRRLSACRCSAMAIRMREIGKLLHSIELFPERAHLVGAYSLGKAQRVIALIRKAGFDKPIYLHGAMEKVTRFYERSGIDLGELRAVQRRKESRSRRHDHALPALGAEGSLVAPFPRSGLVLCVRLDARARPRAAGACRIAAGDFRSCRLGRIDGDHRRDRRVRNLGHAWAGRCAGALVPARTG